MRVAHLASLPAIKTHLFKEVVIRAKWKYSKGEKGRTTDSFFELEANQSIKRISPLLSLSRDTFLYCSNGKDVRNRLKQHGKSVHVREREKREKEGERKKEPLSSKILVVGPQIFSASFLLFSFPLQETLHVPFYNFTPNPVQPVLRNVKNVLCTYYFLAREDHFPRIEKTK